jgi:pilus assembly protein Flp/PilA
MVSFGLPRRLKVVLGRIREDDGQALVEYALLISLIAIVCIAGVGTFGLRVSTMYSQVVTIFP